MPKELIIAKKINHIICFLLADYQSAISFKNRIYKYQKKNTTQKKRIII